MWWRRGVNAGALVRALGPIIDGSGGGRPDMAQAGGKDASKLDEALAAVVGVIRNEVMSNEVVE